MTDLPPESARDDIDRLAHRLWSVHPRDIPEGVTRARFYSDEIRKLISDPRKVIAESEPSPTQRDALMDIETMLLDVRRYPNMKAFPVVVSLCRKAANRAAEALGRRIPFENVHDAP
ncbi:MAG: hypothetical protein DI537_43960 [Stutzerimonas stutzeri]|nr:MAG: hypothetical protein DI537_43960 [Stutzerimonas stutzeri]